MIKVDRVVSAGDYGLAVIGNGGEEQLTILLTCGQCNKTRLTLIATQVDMGQWILVDELTPTPGLVDRLRQLIPLWSRDKDVDVERKNKIAEEAGIAWRAPKPGVDGVDAIIDEFKKWMHM
jgi:hypothetical protein